ncbi:MAG: asparagine synthase (glutamine-hydrolyzing) [Firmicutes bacterium]|nr:asparagine synthase (glutamine-hydrolyzing) [Bacillota bacterium]
MSSHIYGKINLTAQTAVLDAEPSCHLASMSTPQHNYTLLLYGDIFNTTHLRAEAAKYDTQATGYDTAKILLVLFAHLGKKSFALLDGMYTIAIYDSTCQGLTLVRDRLGSRSLLYATQGDTFVFASDFATLFKKGGVKPVFDKASLQHIFLLGPAHNPTNGVFKGVSALAAGHFVTYGLDGIKTEKYWSLQTKDLNGLTEKQAVDQTRTLIQESIDRTLSTHTPPAIFLSGGLDSSIVAAVAASKYNRTGQSLDTYSIDFEDSQKDFLQNSFQPTLDRDFVGTMVERIGSTQHDITLSNQSLADTLYETAVHRGLPGMADVDSSLYLFAKQVAKDNAFALSGECADEIFGGYPWYHIKEIRDFDGFPWSRSLDMRTQLLRGCTENTAKDFVKAHYQDTLQGIEYHSTEDDLDKRIRQLFVLNLSWFGATLLERKERMTVAAGITVRMPFTDYRLIEFAYNLPWQHKALHGREKGIMREAFRDTLPTAITERKKSPFPKTYSTVYLSAVKNLLMQTLDKTPVLKEIVNTTYLDHLLTLDPNDTTQAPWYGQLMRLPQIFAFVVQLGAIIQEFGVEIE